jgi:hypothetical protein
VFGVHRFKLHSQLVDGTVKSVWFRQVFGLLGVRFRQVFGLLGVRFRQVFGLLGVWFRQVSLYIDVITGEDVLSCKKCFVNHNKYVFGILSKPED